MESSELVNADSDRVEGSNMEKTVYVLDAFSGDFCDHCFKVNIEVNKKMILITPEGFGDSNSKDGEGTPIMIEFRDGVPYIVLWGDINEEEATDIISLEGAKESLRVDKQ